MVNCQDTGTLSRQLHTVKTPHLKLQSVAGMFVFVFSVQGLFKYYINTLGRVGSSQNMTIDYNLKRAMAHNMGVLNYYIDKSWGKLLVSKMFCLNEASLCKTIAIINAPFYSQNSLWKNILQLTYSYSPISSNFPSWCNLIWVNNVILCILWAILSCKHIWGSKWYAWL